MDRAIGYYVARDKANGVHLEYYNGEDWYMMGNEMFFAEPDEILAGPFTAEQCITAFKTQT